MRYPTLAPKRVAVVDKLSKICCPASWNLVQFSTWICANSLSYFSVKCKDLTVSWKVIVWTGTTFPWASFFTAVQIIHFNSSWLVKKMIGKIISAVCICEDDYANHIYHHCSWLSVDMNWYSYSLQICSFGVLLHGTRKTNNA